MKTKNGGMKMLIEYDIVKFASIECKLQMSGELSVGWMIDAFIYAIQNQDRLPELSDVLNIGRLVEPNVNYNGFRKVDVRVGWDVKMPWEEVPDFMGNIMEDLHNREVSNEEFIYQSLGVCHPFRDGNGRTHQILWNWLEGTLNIPTWHKDFWNDPRRTIGYGA